MKTLIVLTLALAVALLQSAYSQTVPAPPQISVSGSSEVKVAPDQIYLRVGVETHDIDLARAKSRNDASVSRTLAFLKKNGIDAKDIQTDFVSVDPVNPNGQSWSSDSTGEGPAGYVVRKAIEIKLTKMDAFDNIMTGLLTNGVNSVQGIDFRTSKLREYRDRARAMAIRAAKEKADALGAELGVKVGKVYNINAEDNGGWGNYSGGWWGNRFGGMNNQMVQMAPGQGEQDDGTLSIGQISVSASVQVSFVIQQ